MDDQALNNNTLKKKHSRSYPSNLQQIQHAINYDTDGQWDRPSLKMWTTPAGYFYWRFL
jgi:hypothetical protein